LSRKLIPGTEQKFKMELHGDEKLIGKGRVFYQCSFQYRDVQPDNHPNCCVALETTLSNKEIIEGEGSEVNVVMKNLDDSQGVPMTIALIGLPGGLEPRHRQLKELVNMKVIDYYEVINRYVVIYMREMGPGEVLKFKIDVTATIPGLYVGEASCIYLYYTDDMKNWNEPLSVKIVPPPQQT